MSKICLIIGGTGGLGKACAELAATMKYNIIISGRNERKGDEIVSAITSNNGKAEFIPCDLTSKSAVRNIHRDVIMKHSRIEYAINAAGVTAPLIHFTEIAVSDFNNLMNVNVTAVFISMQEQLRVMSTQETGSSIVNFSSVFGHQGTAWGAEYVASKHAIKV